MVQTFGPSDMLLRVVEGVYPGLKLLVRDQQLELEGHPDDVSETVEIINDLRAVARAGTTIGPEIIEASISGVRAFQYNNLASGPAELIVASQGNKIRPKMDNQKDNSNASNHTSVDF